MNHILVQKYLGQENQNIQLLIGRLDVKAGNILIAQTFLIASYIAGLGIFNANQGKKPMCLPLNLWSLSVPVLALMAVSIYHALQCLGARVKVSAEEKNSRSLYFLPGAFKKVGGNENKFLKILSLQTTEKMNIEQCIQIKSLSDIFFEKKRDIDQSLYFLKGALLLWLLGFSLMFI